jgi:hypothetical protein
VSLQLDDEAVVVSECVLDVSVAWSMLKVGIIGKELDYKLVFVDGRVVRRKVRYHDHLHAIYS